ncbi:penicillin-binding transpeptidase domain-containing protein [Peptostreptococcus equinus]|uniref:Penicillin-binding transpeptidase domain-containing protein n=1 Tax=Peptostreptococcus equinus TaxID=3003601 RepID=A0ABY7JM95_9FIRM|nr:penicillin-binding transpeptidase domain-containing protein [Peptostreptococcus sp. CBA3647]WAW14284.1 penicillin-binding transpeptidase domain-containing protein [Peptostreptococcus sp. CBA3647]
MKKRLKNINKIILIILAIVFGKIFYMTTFMHEHYSTLADQKTYKQIKVQAPRGEIRDRNGILLAGNQPEFTAQIIADSFNKKGVDKNTYQNKASYSLINILEKNKEKYVDEFPIVINGNSYVYTFDKKISDFKRENNIPQTYEAKKTFYLIVDELIKDGQLTMSDRDKDPTELQKKLNSLGYYPPIMVSEWIFTEQKNKNDWLEGYKLKSDVSAQEAFNLIRSKYYKIDSAMSDSEARKIMLIRDMIKSKVYTQYNPVTVAKGLKNETVVEIEENSMNLSGVSVAVQQKRVYPNAEEAAHILGYVGKIPSEGAEDYVKKGYFADDSIGLAGIEKSYESKLKGENGYKEVKVDSVGRVIEEMKSVSPTSGDTVYLTIDSKVQKTSDESLKKAIESAKSGSAFESKFGSIKVGMSAPNAKSGALIAVDVNNGDVLAMSSYPSYDPNKFADGISKDDYNEYIPKNQNDILAANPLINLATQGVFQPGSVFKMITGVAALESGLSTSYTINDPGFIKFGNKIFADYVWHHEKKNHGIVDIYKALQESCNIFFFVIGSDRNWMTGQDLHLGMGAKKILEYAKKFGLDSPTGLEDEIEARNGRVPSERQKIESTKIQLKNNLDKLMRTHFYQIDYESDNSKFEEKIMRIVSWADEDKAIGRVEAMNRLKKLGVKDQYIEKDADNIVYSYLKFAKWGVGDTFNLAIGQGENAYTPAQVVRYTSALANGGYLVDLNLVNKSVDNKGKVIEESKRKLKKIDLKDDSNLEKIKVGMVRVSTDGLAKTAFSNFPIKVASKTGTAEKSGKIPTENEFEYLKSHLDSYNVDKNQVMKIYEELKNKREGQLVKEKEESIKAKIKNPDTDSDIRKKLEKELKDGIKIKIDKSDKETSSLLRRAIKEVNTNISNDEIDRFKSDYGAFGWFVAYAPADNPKIAVACMIPQGETSSYAVLPVREVIAEYFGLKKDDIKVMTEEETKNESKSNSINKEKNKNYQNENNNDGETEGSIGIE